MQTQQTCHEMAGQEIPIVLAANQAFVPILYTCLQSLVNCTNPNHRYHIYIFHTEISKADMRILCKGLAKGHVLIDFVDVRTRMAGYRLRAKEHITTETFYRFLILEFFADDAKVIYLDADTIVCQDIAKLYRQELGDSLLAAAVDPDFAGQCHGANPDTRQYCEKVLHLKDPYRYAQAGVLVFNMQALRKAVHVPELFTMAQTGIYRYADQDILNIVCQGRIKKLAMSWNVLADSGERRHSAIRSAPADILKEYAQARRHPYIIHYAGACKPWQDPQADFANVFWQNARQSPYYEQLLYQMCRDKRQGHRQYLAKKVSGICKKAIKNVLPQDSLLRRGISSLYWKWK